MVTLLVCFGLWMLCPKGFNYAVGTWLGICAGGLAWCIGAFVFPALLTWFAFLVAMTCGIFVGCLTVARWC